MSIWLSSDLQSSTPVTRVEKNQTKITKTVAVPGTAEALVAASTFIVYLQVEAV